MVGPTGQKEIGTDNGNGAHKNDGGDKNGFFLFQQIKCKATKYQANAVNDSCCIVVRKNIAHNKNADRHKKHVKKKVEQDAFFLFFQTAV
jgi:hypothetical protein